LLLYDLYLGRQTYHPVTSLEQFLIFTADDMRTDMYFAVG